MNHVKYDRSKPTVWAIKAQIVGCFFILRNLFGQILCPAVIL